MTLAIHDAIAVAALICVLGIFTSLVRGPQVPAAAGATSGAAGGRP